jgi:hypothetical protein
MFLVLDAPPMAAVADRLEELLRWLPIFLIALLIPIAVASGLLNGLIRLRCPTSFAIAVAALCAAGAILSGH